MTPGDIIAFEVTGEPRKIEPRECMLFRDGSTSRWPGSTQTTGIYIPIRPIPSPEIAEAQRVLAAVGRHRETLTEIVAGYGVPNVERLVAIIKEILGS